MTQYMINPRLGRDFDIASGCPILMHPFLDSFSISTINSIKTIICEYCNSVNPIDKPTCGQCNAPLGTSKRDSRMEQMK